MKIKNRLLSRGAGVVLVALAISSWAHSQTGNRAPSGEVPQRHAAQGYLFFAPGAVVTSYGSAATWHFGGGGEALVYKGLGVGGEIGYVTPARDWSAGIGILSVDGSYHFAQNRRISPFVTGGYSLGFRQGHANFVNFGGGLTYWFRDRHGIRVEFRDHLEPQYTDAHYLSVRIAYAFR